MAANASSPNVIGSPTTPSAQPATIPEAPPKGSRRKKTLVKKEQSVDPIIESTGAAAVSAGQFNVPATPAVNG
ncbi:hypothetical protein BGZ65_011330, partial [Modicella reniformis]